VALSALKAAADFLAPLAPGEGPEVVPPDFASGEKAKDWGADLYGAIEDRLRRAARHA
jgi:hypothetical protein